jgi:GTPase involved in cell partitioning and DNA repair
MAKKLSSSVAVPVEATVEATVVLDERTQAIINEVSEFVDESRAKAAGLLQFKYDMSARDAAQFLAKHFGSATSSADVESVVKVILECESKQLDTKTTRAILAQKMGWATATATTVLTHVKYMREYAAQVNN